MPELRGPPGAPHVEPGEVAASPQRHRLAASGDRRGGVHAHTLGRQGAAWVPGRCRRPDLPSHHEHRAASTAPAHRALGVPAHVRRAGPPAARHHLHRRRPRDDRRLGRGRVDDHRDRRGQGAGRGGARRVPDPGQPAHRDPAVHRGAHRHQQLDGRRRPAHRLGAAGLPRVRGGHRPGRPQRAVRRRVPAPLRRAAGPRLAQLRGPRHRQAGPPGDHPRRRPNCKLSSLARVFRSRPRRTTGRCPTPGRRSTSCTA